MAEELQASSMDTQPLYGCGVQRSADLGTLIHLGIDAETGEPVTIEEEAYERTDQIRWKTGHLAPRAYAEGPPIRPPGSPPEAAKRKAARMRASGQHWGTW